MNQTPFPESLGHRNRSPGVSRHARFVPGRRLLAGTVGVALLAYVVVILVGPILRGWDTYFSFSRLYIWTAALRAGDPFSTWTPIDANGFGSPVPFFYHKLFNLVGAVLTLASGDIVTGYRLGILVFSSIMFAGIYTCAGRFGADTVSRSVIATASLLAPYMVSKLVQSGAVAEYAATALVPFILVLVIDAYAGRFAKWRAAALFVFLLLIAQAHVLDFVFALGLLLPAFLYLTAVAPRRGWPPLATTIAALAVFFGFTYAPFTFWSAYFSPDQANVFGHIKDNLLSPGYLFWRDPRSQFGWPIFALMIFMAIQLRHLRQARTQMSFVLGCVTFAVIFMMTRFSRPLWEISTQLDFVQYPWRLLTVATPLCFAALAGMIERLAPGAKQRVQFGLLVIALANAACMLYVYNRELSPIPGPQLRREEPSPSIEGPDAGGEYFPAAYRAQLARIDVLKTPATSVLPAPRPLVEGTGCVYTDVPRPAYFDSIRVSVTCPAGGHLRVNQFATPFLESYAGQPQGRAIEPLAGSRFIEFALPSGEWTVVVRKRTYFELVVMAWQARLSQHGL